VISGKRPGRAVAAASSVKGRCRGERGEGRRRIGAGAVGRRREREGGGKERWQGAAWVVAPVKTCNDAAEVAAVHAHVAI
jgi:hypothetical protein